MVFGMVHSDRTVVVLLCKQTVPISDCWHIVLSKPFALTLTLSELLQTVCTLLWASLALRHMSTVCSPLHVGSLCLNSIQYWIEIWRWMWRSFLRWWQIPSEQLNIELVTVSNIIGAPLMEIILCIIDGHFWRFNFMCNWRSGSVTYFYLK